MSLQEHEALLLGIDPMNWLCVMLETEYPLIDDFCGDHNAVVELFHRRFPNAQIPNIGPASWDIQYSAPMFDNQDAWREMELGNQRSRFSLTDDRDFIIAGLGLPFERLYFNSSKGAVGGPIAGPLPALLRGSRAWISPLLESQI